MTARPNPSPSAPRDPARDDDAARVERYKRILVVLAEVGMAIARLIGGALDERKTGGVLAIATLCLLIDIQTRVFRLVRLAIVLLDRLDQPLALRDASAMAEKGAPETTPPERVERQEAVEAPERAPRPEFSQAFLNRPMEDLIGLICKGLGLDPAWVESAIGPEAAPDFVQVAEACLKVLRRRARSGTRERVGAAPTELRHLASRLIPAGASP